MDLYRITDRQTEIHFYILDHSLTYDTLRLYCSWIVCLILGVTVYCFAARELIRTDPILKADDSTRLQK